MRLVQVLRRVAMAFLLVCCVSGCDQQGRPLPAGKVAGLITLAGEPVTVGRVNFLASEQGFGASGVIQPDGTYTLEGPIPAGSYSVFISFDLAPAERGTDAEEILKSVPAKYQQPQKSGLTADVDDGENDVSFDLES